MKEAAVYFVNYVHAADLIPEIRTNIVYALPEAKSVDEVAGIPGRVTKAFGRAFYCMEPAFGASDHMARLILAAMRYDGELRGAINVGYSQSLKGPTSSTGGKSRRRVGRRREGLCS